MPTAARSKAIAAPSSPAKAIPSALSSASISTSEQLVKALRVPQPPANGVKKIDIASEAWRSASFFVPKKAELLSQWVLEHLCSSFKASTNASAQGTPNKGKNKQQQLSPSGPSEFDTKSWELLAAIVSTQTATDSELSEAAKRSWLSHLASIQPVVALAGALAKQLAQAENLSQEEREALLSSASASLAKLLPPATSRTAATNVEEATDAIQAWLDFFSHPRRPVEMHTGHIILSAIVTTWTTALQYGSNAKRNHQYFCTNAITSLLHALHSLSSVQEDSVLTVVKHVAAESLFTVNVQRSMLQAGRGAEVTDSPSWKDTKTQPKGIVQQLASCLDDQQLDQATLGSLATLTDLLCAKISRSEALISIASSNSSTSGSVRETQLALVRKTMLSEWFFPLLPFLVTSADSARRSQRAAARKGILETIERHSLYVLGCDEAGEWRSLFSTLFDSIKHELRHVALDATPSARSELADHFSALTSLWRLEKAVVEDELVSILAMVAVQPVPKEALWKQEELGGPTTTALDFFRAVASIDVRFRTIPTLVSIVLSSISTAAELDEGSLSSNLFTSQTFLAELGKLCRDSVTPMQVPDLISRLTGLSQTLPSILGDAEPKAKKQRTASAKQSKAPTSASAALITHLHIAAQVVQSVNLAPTLRARSIAAAEDLHDRLVLPCLDACLSPSRTGAAYGIAAAALRVRQALLSEKWRYDPSEPVKLDGSLPTESLPCLETALDGRADSLVELLALSESMSQGSGSKLCQLQFQIVQSLLQRAERDTFLGLTKSWYCQLLSTESGAIYELIKELKATQGGKSQWTGTGVSIMDRSELMQVLWMVVVTRWASLFESLASQGAMSMLAATVIATAEPSTNGVMQYITSAALRIASFLELPRWRKAIVTASQEELSSTGAVEKRLAATAPLWITPAEWVNRTARGGLLARLLALDRDIAFTKPKKTASNVDVKSWTQLRTLLARVQEEYATEVDASDDALFASLDAFLHAEVAEGEAKHGWEHASLAAIEASVRVLIQRGKQREVTQTRLLEVARQARSEAAAVKGGEITLQMRASQHMLIMLSSDAVSEGVVSPTGEHLNAIKSLATSSSDVAQTLDIALYHLREIHLSINRTAAEIQELMIALSKDVVAVLCNVFSRATLAVESDSDTKLVRPTAEVALELVRCIEACGATISTSESARASAVAACLGYSALLASMPQLSEQRKSVECLQRFISRLEAEAYDSVLSCLLTALRTTVSSTDIAQATRVDGDAAAVILTTFLVLGSAPEGTSKIARAHLSSLLALLTCPSTLFQSGLIRLRTIVAAVGALETLTSHQAMLLRTQGMASILQLFSTLTGPSMSDRPSLTLVELPRAKLNAMRTRIFDSIVGCLGSLMRLRQDLVLSLLAQLGSLLARLATLFRRLRPNASGVHKRQLRRDLPAWLDPELTSPLNAGGEARALSRLLSQLIAKSVSLKTRAEGREVKAESLARPFSKHATYVLVAYLRSLTEGGWVVAPDVRAELEVGMLTVCEIMGHHQRDAAMVGLLDAGGRVLLKRIWAEYEKSRYKGQ